MAMNKKSQLLMTKLVPKRFEFLRDLTSSIVTDDSTIARLYAQRELVKQLTNQMNVEFDELVQSGINPHLIFMSNLKLESRQVISTNNMLYNATINVYVIRDADAPHWHDLRLFEEINFDNPYISDSPPERFK